MGQETLTEKRDWLHFQLNGAITFAVLTTFFVSLRCVGLGILKYKNLIRFSFWEDALILMSLLAFLPLCACVIGKDPALDTCTVRTDDYQWTRMHTSPCIPLQRRSRT